MQRGRRQLLEIFSERQITVDSMALENLNHASNALMVDANMQQLFGRFLISIRANAKISPSEYWMESFMDEDHLPQVTRDKVINKTLLEFGRIHPVGLPNPHSFNVHYAIGCVLHASGATEIISAILRNEEEEMSESEAHLQKRSSQSSDETVMHSLHRKLKGLEAPERFEKAYKPAKRTNVKGNVTPRPKRIKIRED